MSPATTRHLIRLSLIAAGVLVSLAAVAVWKPYIEVTEVRATATPQTVQAGWYLGCEQDYFEDAEGRRYLLQFPPEGEAPAVGVVMMPGTRFALVGFAYSALRRNRFTGNVEEQRSERFDVIEWHVLPPYFTWDGEKEIERDEPVGWKSASLPAQFIARVDRPRKTC